MKSTSACERIQPGFTPQKPLWRAYERDPAKVKKWLDEEYQTIRRQAKREKAETLWGDKMGLRSDHQTETSYGRKGETPTIPGTGQHFSCNMISTVTNQSRLTFMVFTKGFTADVMLQFLRRLARQAERKVFLIVDGHPVHRSRKVKRWVKEHKQQIRLVQLPGYSPDLNSDELLNQDVKPNAFGPSTPKQPNRNDWRCSLLSSQHPTTTLGRQELFLHETVQYAA